ncbi:MULTISPECIES: cytochrome P450 [unclassified Deinococcus]|uniref:cytochrome P450 n=1 Tax=unclassified Deinococcus TaxID=2623546 RepID=UPI0006DBF425|nr:MULTISPECIES: cytochrome P450 [unclassified Deinococcus]MCD0160935.1 cytochrome P450 [Deinococcus sp. 6YEL10]MCD0168124.1 cytochrome P450 [Deinococcus sp. 23YEL01]PIG95567.1 cytochrome P450 [Deinococcus sp. UR1]
MTTPAGPPPLPVLGNLLDFGRDPLGFLDRVTQQYGCGVKIRIESERDTYVVTDPAQVEEVLINTGRTFQKGYQRHPLMRLVLGNGLVTSEGEFWLRQRRLAQPAFHRARIASYGETMVRFADRQVQGWQDGQDLNLSEAMMHLTMEIITQTVFDVDLYGDPRAQNVSRAVNTLLDEYAHQMTSAVRALMERLPVHLPVPGEGRLRRAVHELDVLILALVAERRAEDRDHGDLLSMFLSAQDEDGQGMTDAQLRDELVTLFLAGHETTANALTWTFFLLAQHPAAEATLHAELRGVLGGRLPTVQDLAHLPYTAQVVKEVLRLYPPVWWVSREPQADWPCDDVLIPAGAEVGISPWVMHRDAQFYPEPLAFQPERWTPEFEAGLPRYAYFPFGGGPRLCIGNNFALMEAALVLATVAQRFHVDVPEPRRVVPDPSLTLRPKGGLRVQLRARTETP